MQHKRLSELQVGRWQEYFRCLDKTCPTEHCIVHQNVTVPTSYLSLHEKEAQARQKL